VTDGRTDGRAIAYTRYSIYAVARKNGIPECGRGNRQRNVNTGVAKEQSKSWKLIKLADKFTSYHLRHRPIFAYRGWKSHPSLVWRPRSGGPRQNFWMKLTPQKLQGTARWKLHNPNHNPNRFLDISDLKAENRQFCLPWPWNPGQGSLKVIDSGTNGKRVYTFLLVINSNFCRILHRFGNMAA